MPEPTNTFDWRTLIPQAVALGSRAIGDRVAPGADIQNVQQRQRELQEQQRQFNIQQQMRQQQMGNANQIRSNLMPGMYTALGYNPADARKMAGDYMAMANRPVNLGAPSGGGTYSPGGAVQQPSAPGQGGVGRTVASIGLGMAPAIAGALMKGGAGAAGGAGMGSVIAGLAKNPITLGAAAVGAGALLWRRSQAHPVADKWVQMEQNPFDQSMARIDQSVQTGQMSGEEAQATKTQNAQNYLNELMKFAQQGGREREVANNALRTFRQYYGEPSRYGIQLGGF